MESQKPKRYGLCETKFSVVALLLKSKYRNKLQLKKELKVAISNVKSNCVPQSKRMSAVSPSILKILKIC